MVLAQQLIFVVAMWRLNYPSSWPMAPGEALRRKVRLQSAAIFLFLQIPKLFVLRRLDVLPLEVAGNFYLLPIKLTVEWLVTGQHLMG
jgi:hypothetical protein